MAPPDRCEQVDAAGPDCLADTFGAKGDGLSDDASYIQAAVDACSTAGGGRVVLSGCRTYLASSIVLKSNVALHLEKSAVLQANTDFAHFIKPAKIKYADKSADSVYKPSMAWIYAYGQHNLSITGEGTLVGNADSVTGRISRYYVAEKGLPRPTLVYLENCKNVAVTGISIMKAPFWTLHLAGCDTVAVSRIRICNDLDCANSDGIDPDHCKNVLIEDCHIECADDCIVLKNTRGNTEYGDCENITIRNCTLISTSAAFKIGTESFGNFRNVDVSDCNITNSNRGISLQLRDFGAIEHVTFKNIRIETRRFSGEWWGCGEPVAITALAREPLGKYGVISDIRFENISCDSENGILIYASQEGHLENIVFDHVAIRLSVKSKWHGAAYDLRPGFHSGMIKKKPSAFLISHAARVSRNSITVIDELPSP